ncbi:MAG TPA: DNA recombination protein RmuC [Terracidiphilus sp.]|jgi:DNA recombination protein RmuC|nr:DNA recombination protein RmuC [Terracidiphilus sp.]
MQALIAALAAVLGIILGYWLRQLSAKSEKASAENEKAQLAQRAAELAADLASQRGEMAVLREVADHRAPFEQLCIERQGINDRLTAERDRIATDLQAKADSERALAAQVSQLNADLANEKGNASEKIALMEDKFRIIASAAIDDLGKKYGESSKAEIGHLLAPLQTQIKEFREKVEQAQSDSKTGVTKLETLIGTLGNMNQQLTEEARSLTTALRGSAKAQGDWGELIVRNLLEKAGLREGEQFRVQETFDSAASEDERRKVRPDVILNLPGNRHLIIDSKVSLNAYADSVNAATEEERKLAMKRHLASIRAHVDGLAARKYHKLDALDSPDFVVMFVPIEPAFLAALYEDEGLWRYAYEKEVLLVGPTTLLFVIRIVDNLWQQELQARNVQEVMDRGAALYEKFVNFVSDLEGVGNALRNVDKCYTGAMKKLSEGPGNLVRQVEMLKQLGVKSSKSLPKTLLDTAGVEEPLALAASAGEPVAAE